MTTIKKKPKNISDISTDNSTKIKIDPFYYWKEVYRNTGNYLQEDKFDSSIGLKWLGDYMFSIVDSAKWNKVKNNFEPKK